MSRATDIAWAAGLWDGEGCTTISYNRNPRKTRTGPTLTVTMTQAGPGPAPPEVLTRFLNVVAEGRIYGPYTNDQRPGRSPVWWWRATSDKAVRVITLLYPYLSGPKREQAQRSLLVIANTGGANWVNKPISMDPRVQGKQED